MLKKTQFSKETTLKYPYAKHLITEDDEHAVLRVLKSPSITRGPAVSNFEAALCEHTGARYSICFTNASLALWACIQAVEASSKDIAFVPTNTFIATASAAMNKNCRLSLVDIVAGTGNMDLESFQAQIAEMPKGVRRLILPVHFTGKTIDMHQLSGMALNWEDVIIEDAAHALGSYYPTGEKVGSCAYSDMTVFSFHACKNITCGEGGAVMTNDALLAQKLRQIRDSGLARKEFPTSYDVELLAVNSHMNDLQAALGHSQLKRESQIKEHKTKLLERYKYHLGNKLVSQPDPSTHYHLCIALLTDEKGSLSRAKLMQQLLEKGVGTQIHYPALYDLSVIRHYPKWLERHQKLEYWPGMQQYKNHTLSLPLYPSLQVEEVDEICEIIKKITK